MKNFPTRFLSASSLLGAMFVAFFILLPSCVSGPAEGFVLAIQLSGVRSSAVDNVRLVLTPADIGGMPQRFQMPEVTSFEDGAIRLSVDDRGQLVILIDGAYFQANAIPAGPGDLDPRFELELWSDDELPRMMTPQIRGVVVAGGFESAAGAAFLPSWPLPLGDSFTLTLPCTMGREAMCVPTP